MSHDHDHTVPPSDLELRVKALESLLLEKGLVKQDALDAIIETYEHKVGPKNGAHVVAKAWSDLSFKHALLEDATATVAELGYVGRQGEHLTVVENNSDIHNLVVCTLCSCYPWTLLGLPPVWYKSAPYRARAVSEPRVVLCRIRHGVAGAHGHPGMGLHLRDALSGSARAAIRHRGLERVAVAGSGDSQQYDWR